MRTLIAITLTVLSAMVVTFESPVAAQSTPTPRLRPTRYPRPDIGRPVRTPRPGRPERPTRVITGVVPSATPTLPASTPAATATPTPTRTPGNGGSASCENACAYDLSQMRLTWYDAASGGLNLSFYVRGGDCPAFAPQAGEAGSIKMDRWLTERKQDTGRLHVANFTVGSDGSGATSTGGTANISVFGAWQQISYRANTPPIAGPQDGADFPVVFDLCLTVGDQAVKGRMVCQEKSRGLLCHEG